MLALSLKVLLAASGLSLLGWGLLYVWRAQNNKCENVNRAPGVSKWWDPFDICWMCKMLVAALNGTLHDLEQSTYDKLSREAQAPIRTFQFTRAGGKFIHTMDPMLFQAVLVKQFDDFGMGRRTKYFGPLLGQHSIVSASNPGAMRLLTSAADRGRKSVEVPESEDASGSIQRKSVRPRDDIETHRSNAADDQ